MRNRKFWMGGITMVALAGCGGSSDYPAPRHEALEMAPEIEASAMTDQASGLSILDLMEGDGDQAMAGQRVTIHYNGWHPDGTLFDSSLSREEPLQFVLGFREVIRGWEVGIRGMKVGGRRILVIPPDLGYGSRGLRGVVPRNATLVFEVRLLSVGD
jgi:FKBP-type peptidyl-prolyl cis-trans isomerase FkpA